MTTEFSIHDEPSRRKAVNFISALSLDRQKWKVEVKRKTKRRSLSQNALMWKWHTEVVDAVCRDTGNTKEDIHNFFKQQFLKPRVVEIGGRTGERYTTTELSVREMHEYMEQIYAFVTTELGILLPLPVEYMRNAA